MGEAALIGGPFDGETITPNEFMGKRILFVGNFEDRKAVKFKDWDSWQWEGVQP